MKNATERVLSIGLFILSVFLWMMAIYLMLKE